MTAEELAAISKTSVAAISVLGISNNGIESFVTDDMSYCIQEGENEDDIREHAKCGNIPIGRIEEIKSVIDRTTANSFQYLPIQRSL